ncbi:hypothetical protein CY35_12G045900 [Sphagnum magellanicum]|nr:hypothetical protein CY35_12G045900 [Sphagnum magellanicum]
MGDKKPPEAPDGQHEAASVQMFPLHGNQRLRNPPPPLAELEARAAVKFNSFTFAKELVYHIFYPVSVPLMWWLDGGWLSLVNRGFFSLTNPRLAFGQALLALCFYTFNGVSLVYAIKENKLVFLYDIILVDLLWVIRNAVVATKYAFASTVDINNMRTAVMDPSVLLHMTLLGGWKDPIPRKVLKEELLLAATRCRMLLPAFSFHLDTTVNSLDAIHDIVSDLQLKKDNPNKVGAICKNCTLDIVREANRWLEAGKEECLDAVICPGKLPVHLYAAHIIRQSSSLRRLRRVGHTMMSQHLRLCSNVIAVIIAVLPIALHLLFGGHKLPGPFWTVWAIAPSSVLLMYFSMWSNIAFMMVGILDFRRRHYVASKLDELLRTGVYNGSVHIRVPSFKYLQQKSFEFLRRLQTMSWSSSRSGSTPSSRSSSSNSLTGIGIWIDFDNPDSLQAWWICRVLLHDFGLHFHLRIKYYTTYFACYCGLLILVLFLRLLSGIKEGDIYILVTVIVILDVFLTLLALMAWPGGDINNVRQQHGATLVSRKLKLQLKTQKEKLDLTAEQLKRRKIAIETTTCISEAVNYDNAQNKVSVCGFEAGEQLLGVIVAIVTASISIGIGQIFTNVVNSSNLEN